MKEDERQECDEQKKKHPEFFAYGEEYDEEDEKEIRPNAVPGNDPGIPHDKKK